MREVSYGSGVDQVVPSSENCILVVAVAPVALEHQRHLGLRGVGGAARDADRAVGSRSPARRRDHDLAGLALVRALAAVVVGRVVHDRVRARRGVCVGRGRAAAGARVTEVPVDTRDRAVLIGDGGRERHSESRGRVRRTPHHRGHVGRGLRALVRDRPLREQRAHRQSPGGPRPQRVRPGDDDRGALHVLAGGVVLAVAVAVRLVIAETTRPSVGESTHVTYM